MLAKFDVADNSALNGHHHRTVTVLLASDNLSMEARFKVSSSGC
jgi:hypothetical protein